MLAIKSTNVIAYTLLDKDTGNPVSGATVTAKIRQGFAGEYLSDEELEFTEDDDEGVYLYTLSPAELINVKYGNVYYFEFTSVADGVTFFDVEPLLALTA
ncbi:hypothetical protein [Anatilimnocola floriformis]|uniref:hypothetical protein n=1 Tax=Anatilimnocola floriformis TaxID=2948575 RepID=UPI0020C21610|nr:hypothetical protein [Anatilimnocola floriformis]